MCGSNDPFTSYLKSFGYNPIRLPRASLHPLQVLAKANGELTWLGEMADVFESSVPLPPVAADTPAGAISGKRTSDLSIGVALSLLGGVIGALGGSRLGLDLAYKRAKTAVFEFPEVFEDGVGVAKLDQYLAGADVRPIGPSVEKMLEADELYVTTSCIKSRKFTLDAHSESGASVSVDVPVIQQAVGGSVKVGGSNTTDAKVTYEGTIPLVFGFQAVQLFYDKRAYTVMKPAQGVVARALGSAPRDGAARLVTQGTFASIRVP